MKAVLLADLHVGSRWALADPKELSHPDSRTIQTKLFAEWRRAAEGPWHGADALVVCGDAIDGQGRKDGGTQQWTTDVDEQVCHCADLLKMWGARKVYIIGGSKYHVMLQDTGLSGEEMLGRKIGAEEYPNQKGVPVDHRHRSGPQWFLTFENVTAHFAHHVGVSRVFHYKSTPIAREMMQAKLNDPLRREWERMYRDAAPTKKLLTQLHDTMDAFTTKIVVRGHTHYYWSCDAGGSLGLNLPAWKVPDPWIQERDPLGFGHLGFIGLEVDNGDWRIQKNLFRIESVAAPPHSRV